MKHWFEHLPVPARNFVLILGGGISLLIFVALLAVVSYWIEGASAKSNAVAVIERLRGYAEVEAELEASVVRARAQLKQLAFSPQMSADQASANLQRDLRAYAKRAVLTVVGSQAMEENADEGAPGFERLAVQLSLNGSPLSLDLFLQSIYSHQPALRVESLNIVDPPDRGRRRASVVVADDKLNIRIVVAALREIDR